MRKVTILMDVQLHVGGLSVVKREKRTTKTMFGGMTALQLLSLNNVNNVKQKKEEHYTF